MKAASRVLRGRGGRLFGAALAAAACTSFLFAATGASGEPSSSGKPDCNGEQQFTGQNGPFQTQFVTKCSGATVRSIRVENSGKISAVGPAPVSDSKGAGQPPPEGFVCHPTSDSAFTCDGQANEGHVTRITGGSQDSPCDPTNRAKVIIGTDQSDQEGNPQGATDELRLNEINGCGG